jgi:hypothetical protein
MRVPPFTPRMITRDEGPVDPPATTNGRAKIPQRLSQLARVPHPSRRFFGVRVGPSPRSLAVFE